MDIEFFVGAPISLMRNCFSVLTRVPEIHFVAFKKKLFQMKLFLSLNYWWIFYLRFSADCFLYICSWNSCGRSFHYGFSVRAAISLTFDGFPILTRVLETIIRLFRFFSCLFFFFLICGRLFKCFFSQVFIALGCGDSEPCGDSGHCAVFELNHLEHAFFPHPCVETPTRAEIPTRAETRILTILNLVW